MSRRLFSVKQIEAALRASGGIQAAAAAALEKASGIKCSRKIVNDAVKRHLELQTAILEAEATLDLAEDKLLQAIDAGDVNATRFYLETKGKHRGYTRRAYTQHLLSLDPRKMTDAELVAANRQLEALIDINAEPVEPPRTLPAPIKRSRD